MDDELECLSTEELIGLVTNDRCKFCSVSVGSLLSELVQRALVALKKAGESEYEEVEADLSALSGECCYSWLVSLLSSSAINARALAGATYLLALLTAGESKYAEDFRGKVAGGCGVVRLVALLSAESVSVRFNALLALGNLLRHCPSVHFEILRLGATRKLDVLFKQACEEPQQNVCVDALLCLCDSDVPGMCEELLRAGFIVELLDWISDETSDRVSIKSVKAISALLDKSCSTRSVMLQLDLIQPLLSLLKNSNTKELCMVIITTLESVCCREDGVIQRSYFLENGGVKLLMQIIQEFKDKDLLVQAVQLLSVLAMADIKFRKEIITASSGLQFLQDLCSTVYQENNAGQSIQISGTNENFELSTLQDDHIAAIRLLFKVCNSKSPIENEPLNCGPLLSAASGRVAA